MDFAIIKVLDNGPLFWGLISCGGAQFSKLIFEIIKNKKFRVDVLFETGGMPSSHSALVTGTAASVGVQDGFNSSLFAIAATFAFIVMYDASGIRKAAGLTSERVNILIAESDDKPLKENLGHTKLEVAVGSIFGPMISIPGMLLIGTPLNLIHRLGIL